ncbi:hypothetical protein HER10_EVM0000760 [Colletotrichum scovillei]|uniref:uncharacterized protein n=1 Tax=Colletotrichum scovillei TaxID=1209932 RepID=UPI0015C40A34|nr:uncharacterized protein HER10_EVM0000760 [Colletotrichum scovillei]KAF4779078.1 hypothetical protein HER10_EVM0000760 [Colletotrichum scovillei]
MAPRSEYSRSSTNTRSLFDDDFTENNKNAFIVGTHPLLQRDVELDSFLAKKSVSGVDRSADDTTNHTATWCPTWLRSGTLLAFAALFLLFGASLIVMFQFSQQNSGLVTTRQSLVYLWRFGPTAILTLLSIFWSRVELQAIRYMPWIAYRDNPSMSRGGYSLDYTAMLSPSILYQSLRRRHFLVFIIAVVSLFIKIQIILAPSLYSLVSFQAEQLVDVHVLDSFNVSTPAMSNRETSAYYIAKALQNFEMKLPFGVTKEGAYQTFSFRQGSGRGTETEPITVTVDGYFAEMKCLKLSNYSHTDLKETGPARSYYAFNASLLFEGCDQPVPVTTDRMMWINSNPNKTTLQSSWNVNNLLNEPKPCSNLPQQHNQSLYYATRIGPSAKNTSHPDVLNFAAILCSSTAWTTPVEIVDDGVSPNMTVIPGGSRRTVNADLWSLLGSSIPETVGLWAGSGTGTIFGPIITGFQFNGKGTNNDTDPSLFTNDVLYDAVMNTSSILSPLIGHYRLREEGDSQTTGTTIATIERLTVNQWVSLSMTALFFLLAVLTVIVLLRYRKRMSVWHRDPATILGSMLFFRDNMDLSNSIMASQSRSLDNEWSSCEFTPLVLRTWTRVPISVLIFGIIGGLYYTLGVSKSQEGLASINADGYLHLLWTSVPALVMLCVALYVGCCDFAYRGLATLSSLSLRPCSARLLDMSFLDMMGLRALYWSVRKRVWAVTLSQLLTFLCAFLTTLASVMFTVNPVPSSTNVQLRQTTWFGSRQMTLNNAGSFAATRDSLSSLVLRKGDGALTYPRNTYDDLVFPVLDGLQGTEVSPNISIQLSAPAATLAPTCVQLPASTYNITFRNYTEEDKFFEVLMVESFDCPNGNRAKLPGIISMSTATNRLGRSYFSDILESPGNTYSINGLCKLGINVSAPDYIYSPYRFQTYVWGEFNKDKNDLDHLSIWRCNYTWVETSTKVSLSMESDGIYILDPEKPPEPDLSTTKLWDPPFDVPHFDFQFINFQAGDAFPTVSLNDPLAGSMERQFTVLIEPYGQLPLSALGDPSQESNVLDGLKHNLGFIGAQLANLENRFGVTENSRNRPPPANGLPLLEATIVDRSKRRLVQNPTITYILMAVLGLVALCDIMAVLSAATRHLSGIPRLFDMEVKGLAPDGFHSMASMVNLLQGSNAPSHLPQSVHLLSKGDLYSRVDDLSFRMGCFQRTRGQTRHFTVGVLGDEEFVYLHGGKGIRDTI